MELGAKKSRVVCWCWGLLEIESWKAVCKQADLIDLIDWTVCRYALVSLGACVLKEIVWVQRSGGQLCFFVL